MELRASNDAEQARIRALLVQSGLPVEDLATAAIDFIVAMDGDHLAGVVGLEGFAEGGLLRSLAVDAAHRNAGLGAALVEALEIHARSRGLSQLVLLTQTAETFFAKRGYEVIRRDSAPSSIQGSSEFRAICPASATCMSKSFAN